MTRKQAIVLAVVGAVVAVGVVVGHLMLPVASVSWTVNRLLHYACEGVAGAAAAGGVVWAMWPRRKARRRDIQREEARRRVVAVVACVVVAIALVVFAEMHREAATRALLTRTAAKDLERIGQAVEAWSADHGGARPGAITDLVPAYLPREALYYAHRRGPAAEGPPAEGRDEPPSYALVSIRPRPDGKPPADPVRAYLVPGQAWAPLTVVLEANGRCRVVGEDRVVRLEARRTGAE